MGWVIGYWLLVIGYQKMRAGRRAPMLPERRLQPPCASAQAHGLAGSPNRPCASPCAGRNAEAFRYKMGMPGSTGRMGRRGGNNEAAPLPFFPRPFGERARVRGRLWDGLLVMGKCGRGKRRMRHRACGMRQKANDE